MAVEVQVENITSHLSGWEPQVFLARKYKSKPPLPISGGWGYSKSDAVIIDRLHPAAANFNPFNGLSVEYAFAQLRMYEELIGTRPVGSQHAGSQIKLLDQKLIVDEDGKKYDVLRFNITALPLAVWEALKAEWEGPDGFRSPDFDEDQHTIKRDAATVHYVGEYWFEISSFFGMQDDPGDGPPVRLPHNPAALI